MNIRQKLKHWWTLVNITNDYNSLRRERVKWPVEVVLENTEPITGRLMGRAKLNKKCTSHLCGQQRGLRRTRFKIHRNLGKKRHLRRLERFFRCMRARNLHTPQLRCTRQLNESKSAQERSNYLKPPSLTNFPIHWS